MKKQFIPLLVLYEIFIFFPVFLCLTILTALATIFVAFVFGDVRWGYLPARLWSKAACCLSFVRVEVRGEENYDRNSSYVFVANHQSIFDVFLIYGWLDSHFKWIMKKEIRKIPFVGRACEAAGHIYIDRSNSKSAYRSIELVKKKLVNGVSVAIFPEGSRTKNGSVGKFKRGAFVLASDLSLPIVPITISGAYEVLKKGTFLIIPGKIKMTIHKPLETKDLTQGDVKELMSNCYETIKNDL
ncbi:MAG: 1-acyl-sn-glycerol-3-phosphate acyltransferase [Paludibacteraceae bacterium]|nr:1-acyl-sn-glycerol-3-phosphate acyltransferase [Paludibacteraceae bacterium]